MSVSQAPAEKERFDLNNAHVSGTVQRMWSSGSDVLLRLLVDPSTDESKDERLTLLLPGGCVKGQLITLMKGDRIVVSGHLEDAPYTETGKQFAEKARKGNKLLEDLPGLAEISSERMATYLVVHELTFPEDSNVTANEVILDGVVSRIWSRQEQLFARMAIYDEFTHTDGRVGKNGRPWRQAHYVSVHFVDGKVGGRSVKCKTKDRLRIKGKLAERRYSESLGLYLMRTKKIGLLSNAPNADELREIRTPRVATYVLVDSMIQFTK